MPETHGGPIWQFKSIEETERSSMVKLVTRQEKVHSVV
jgi:hypothetical protein